VNVGPGVSEGIDDGEPDLVSVVVPVYNGGRWIAEAIESVRAQSYRPIEIIAIDDGSADDSAAIVGGYADVRVVRQSNTGCAGARNRGIAESRGEFVAFIDQDDCWTPSKLQSQVAVLRSDPDVGYVLGRQRLFLEPGCPPPLWLANRLELLEEPHVGYLPGTLLVRRSVLRQVGVFDPRYPMGSDSDWLIRARDAGVRMAIVDDVVIEKRIHDANLSSLRSGHAELLTMLAESSRRRRVSATSNPK
jgi:glycosyltransferase involved in cell wall biosynthesis